MLRHPGYFAGDHKAQPFTGRERGDHLSVEVFHFCTEPHQNCGVPQPCRRSAEKQLLLARIVQPRRLRDFGTDGAAAGESAIGKRKRRIPS